MERSEDDIAAMLVGHEGGLARVCHADERVWLACAYAGPSPGRKDTYRFVWRDELSPFIAGADVCRWGVYASLETGGVPCVRYSAHYRLLIYDDSPEFAGYDALLIRCGLVARRSVSPFPPPDR